MSPKQPFFSIVMPTRDRGHLLRYALRSALSQTFDDYEILVSDNHSTDGTKEIVKELADERVRYVNTGERLSMIDSWDFALEHARGRYVTYLCDDDAFRPTMLEKLYSVISEESAVSVAWQGSSYYHPDWPDERDRGKLMLNQTTGEVQEFSSAQTLKDMFALVPRAHYPRLLNSCCSKDFLVERKQQMGKLFFPTCPDYSAAVAVLLGLDSVLFLDSTLASYGLAGASNGSYGFPSSDSISKFMSEYPDIEKVWSLIPLESATDYNQIAVTLVGMKNALPETLAPYQLSEDKLFIHEYQQLKIMESRGADVEDLMEGWRLALDSQSPETQRSVRESVSNFVVVRPMETLLAAEAAVAAQPPPSNRQRAVLYAREKAPGVMRAVKTARDIAFRRDPQEAEAQGPHKFIWEFENILEAARGLERISPDRG